MLLTAAIAWMSMGIPASLLLAAPSLSDSVALPWLSSWSSTRRRATRLRVHGPVVQGQVFGSQVAAVAGAGASVGLGITLDLVTGSA